MITVTLPDGRKVDVQTDDPQKAAKVAHGWATSNPSVEKNTRNTLGGLAGNYLDAMIPGAAGAVRGAREAVVNAVQAPFSDQVDFHPMQAYRKGQAFQEARQKAANAAHPTAANVIQTAGILGGLALPATKVAKGANLLQKATAGAKTAAAYGALSGAMSSKKGSLMGKATDAVSAGALSGMVGAGFPVAAKIAGSSLASLRPMAQPLTRMVGVGLGSFGDYIPGHLGDLMVREGQELARDPVQAAGNRQLGRVIAGANHPVTEQPMRPMQVAQEVERRQERQVPAIAADLDPTLRGRLQGATRKPGPVTARVRQLLEERQREGVERAEQHIVHALGPVANVEGQAQALRREAQAVSRPLYEVSDQAPVPFTPELQELLQRPSAKAAIQKAGRQILDKGEDPYAFGLSQDAEGVFRATGKPTQPLYDRMKRVLDKTVYDGQRPFAAPDVTDASEGAMDIRNTLLRIMDGTADSPGLNPHWKAARDAYSGPTQAKQALELGQDLSKKHANDISYRLDNMPEEAIEHFRLGHRSGLAGNLQAVADTGDVAKRLVGTKGKRDAIVTAHGNDAAQDLFGRMGMEGDATETWKALRGAGKGDPTVDLDALSDAAQGALQIATGHPVGGLWSLTKAAATGKKAEGAINDHVASVLAEPDVGTLKGAMRDVQRERARQALVARIQGRALQRTSRFLGSQIGAEMIQPVD